jgi:alkylation response protein AidB-like acyl-CoA dehydrogenase
VPLPGGGRTWERWRFLASVAAEDLVTARLVEGHLDAVAIIAELEPARPAPPGRLGVWVAEAPRGGMRARREGDGWVLDGTRGWCSGVHEVTTALVTAHAPKGLQLFLVPCDDPAVSPVVGTWPAVGMAESDSLELRFRGLHLDRDAVIGPPGAYLDRPGFWHGGAGVAACWFGGAVGVGRVLRAAVVERPDPHALAHLGAVDAVLSALAGHLRTAAAEIDDDPEDERGTAEVRTRRLRAVVEAGCDEVLARAGRATGAGPMCLDPAHARRVADLAVYLRQSHGEADLAQLGELAAAADRNWILP